MTYKHKTHSVDSDGKVISNADVNFFIDDVSLLTFLFLEPFLFSRKFGLVCVHIISSQYWIGVLFS